jgi:hypothetical protein
MDVGIRQSFQDAARAIKNARTLVITAGAGMGVDSGLPDYRGEKGFWKCYPMYEPLGLNYYDAANPMHFEEDPAFGWGFYAHRIDLYRKTTPHQGFQLLLKWISRFEMDSFRDYFQCGRAVSEGRFFFGKSLRSPRFYSLFAVYQTLQQCYLGK